MIARRIFVGFTIALIFALVGWSLTGTPKARRNDLWRVVNYACVPDQWVFGRPAPCEKVDLIRGFAVVPSVEHADELLLVPTLRISGIEDSRLLDPRTPNYWAYAWAERSKMLAKARAVPDDWVALAVNSAASRTQDQLHIHIDCMKGLTYKVLRHSHIGMRWSIIEPVPGQRYWTRYVSADDFEFVSSFRIVAASLDSLPKFMGTQTIVAVRANGGLAGFYILHQASDRLAHAHGLGEELLDHRCYGLRNALRSSSTSRSDGKPGTTLQNSRSRDR